MAEQLLEWSLGSACAHVDIIVCLVILQPSPPKSICWRHFWISTVSAMGCCASASTMLHENAVVSCCCHGERKSFAERRFWESGTAVRVKPTTGSSSSYSYYL